MKAVSKVAISLPPELLDAVERERHITGQSRSEFFRTAIQALLAVEAERREEQRYTSSYLKHPEGDEEVAWARAGMAGLEEEPWG